MEEYKTIPSELFPEDHYHTRTAPAKSHPIFKIMLGGILFLLVYLFLKP